MNAKIQECFKPHALMHNLFGIGLGLVLAALFPSLAVLWIGVAVVVVALIADMMRK